jgi:hypothetical protein
MGQSTAIAGKAGAPNDLAALAAFYFLQKQTGSLDRLSALTVDVPRFESKAGKIRLLQ